MSQKPLEPTNASSLKLGLVAAVVAIPFTWPAASLLAESDLVVTVFGKSFFVMFSLFKLLEFVVLSVGYMAAESVRKGARGHGSTGDGANE